ncbi:MAG: class I SAM-dependent methyltransferase [Thermodesulfobacteriota bacterium]
MPDWGQIFADPGMQQLEPNSEVLALVPELKAAGCRLILDAGCGAGRHLLPLVQEGFQVLGVDQEGVVLAKLKGRLKEYQGRGHLVQADLGRLPFPAASFDLALSINAINHGYAQTFRDYCRELDRVLKIRGQIFIFGSPREAGETVRLPRTRELEPGTLVQIATPDGDLVHHFPTLEELQAQFLRYRISRLEVIRSSIPFMGGVELPQFLFLAEKLA